MPIVRRMVVLLCAVVPLTACTAQVASDAVSVEVDSVVKAVEHTSGTADKLADAVTGTERGYNMSVTVLSADDLDPAGGDDPAARLTVAFHFEGYPDGFGDVPSLTRCYHLEFNDRGLIGEPEKTECGSHPWSEE